MCQVLRNTELNTDWILYNDKLHIIMINIIYICQRWRKEG